MFRFRNIQDPSEMPIPKILQFTRFILDILLKLTIKGLVIELIYKKMIFLAKTP
jgi:hypothetical protein